MAPVPETMVLVAVSHLAPAANPAAAIAAPAATIQPLALFICFVASSRRRRISVSSSSGIDTIAAWTTRRGEVHPQPISGFHDKQ